jgi:transcriptional regulator with XRE-family HTH domain
VWAVTDQSRTAADGHNGDEPSGGSSGGFGSDYDENASAYGRRVGERLRAIRRQKRLSLQDVEAQSSQEFKASVLGAYERGERAISVPRLERLALFYQVPIDQLLPRTTSVGSASGVVDLTERGGRQGVTLDLTQLDNVVGPEGEMLTRYLAMIQVQRQDFNGRVLTVRQDDLRAVACILGVDVDHAIDRLTDLGLAGVGKLA